jgi:hypothetical protein
MQNNNLQNLNINNNKSGKIKNNQNNNNSIGKNISNQINKINIQNELINGEDFHNNFVNSFSNQNQQYVNVNHLQMHNQNIKPQKYSNIIFTLFI